MDIRVQIGSCKSTQTETNADTQTYKPSNVQYILTDAQIDRRQTDVKTDRVTNTVDVQYIQTDSENERQTYTIIQKNRQADTHNLPTPTCASTYADKLVDKRESCGFQRDPLDVST
jgi:hypothetical protein